MDWRNLQSPLNSKKEFFPQSPGKFSNQSYSSDHDKMNPNIQKNEFQKLFNQYVKKTKRKTNSQQFEEETQQSQEIKDYEQKQMVKKYSEVQFQQVMSQKNKYFTLQWPEKENDKLQGICTDGFVGIAESEFQNSKTIPNYQKEETQSEFHNISQIQNLTKTLESLHKDMCLIKNQIQVSNKNLSKQAINDNNEQNSLMKNSSILEIQLQINSQIRKDLKKLMSQNFQKDTKDLQQKIKYKQEYFKKYKNKLSNFFFENKLQQTQQQTQQ